MIRSLSLLALLFVGTTAATAQDATPMAERTVGYGITELESALFSAIANAGTQYSDARHDAAMAAQWLLLNWKAQHRAWLERRIGGLEEAQRADYDALAETVRAAAQAVAEGPDARANTAAAEVRTMLGGLSRDGAYLADVQPTLFINPDGSATVTLEGNGLANPVVFVDTVAVVPVATDGGLTFDVPVRRATPDAIGFTNFTLYTGEKPRQMLHGRNVGSNRFGVVLPVLPAVVATIEPVAVRATSTSSASRQRSRVVSCEAEEAGGTNTCTAFFATEGDWRVVDGSAAVSVFESRDANDAASLNRVGANGVGVNLSAFRSRRPGSPRGRIAARVTWSETRQTTSVESREIAPDTPALRWGEPVTLQLAPNLDQVSVRLVGFDGTIYEFDGNEENSLATVAYDPATGALTIRPRRIGN